MVMTDISGDLKQAGHAEDGKKPSEGSSADGYLFLVTCDICGFSTKMRGCIFADISQALDNQGWIFFGFNDGEVIYTKPNENTQCECPRCFQRWRRNERLSSFNLSIDDAKTQKHLAYLEIELQEYADLLGPDNFDTLMDRLSSRRSELRSRVAIGKGS